LPTICNDGSFWVYHELQNISGNTVIKIKSVIIFINITIHIIIIIIAIATRRPRLHSHQSDAPQYIKTLDSGGLESRLTLGPPGLLSSGHRELILEGRAAGS
jgi:hypothetical protein